MRILISFALFAILPFVLTEEEKTATEDYISDTQYCNARFKFCVNYPKELFSVSIMSDNGDGIIIKTQDEKSSVTISGSKNTCSRDVYAFYDDFVTDKMLENIDFEMHYSVLYDNSYEAEFKLGDHYVYENLKVQENNFIIYQIKVPKNHKSLFETIQNSVDITNDVLKDQT